jgi:hypothetical protein
MLIKIPVAGPNRYATGFGCDIARLGRMDTAREVASVGFLHEPDGKHGDHATADCDQADSRGRSIGLMQMGSPLGTLLSTGVVAAVTLLGDDALLSWG